MPLKIGYHAEFRCRPHYRDGQTFFRVWAPRRQQVELVLEQSGHESAMPMERADWGYWILSQPELPQGTRYGYRLEGGPVRPDPCTMWQPDGVHRMSALVHPEQFPWSDQHWQPHEREQLVFYELHVGTFTPEGTFAAVIPRLQELKDLGITAIELLPVAQFPGERNWGYDGVHPFAAQDSYGGPLELQKLVDAAHAAGLSIFLDVVYNHLGPEGNYISEFGPYYSASYSTPWGPALNYDGRDSDAVRSFVLENVYHWIHDFHFDGLRLDAVHAVFDKSPVHLLAEIKQVADAAAQARGSRAIIVAESLMNDVRMIRAPEEGGYGLDAEWNEDFHHAVQAYLTGEEFGKYADFGEASHLATIFEKTFSLAGRYSRFRGRRWGAEAAGLPGSRFVAGIQNHDHVGNRAHGERIAHLVSPAQCRLAASLSLLSPFLPLIFMGEEYGETNPFPFFCSFQDEGLIENVRKGRARDYDFEGEVPDPQDPAEFEKAILTWSWPEGTDSAGMRRLYQTLLEFRRHRPIFLNSSREARLLPDEKQGLVLEWKYSAAAGEESLADEDDDLYCYFNLTGVEQSLKGARIPKDLNVLFLSEVESFGAHSQPAEGAELKLQPWECMVIGKPSA